MYIFQAALVIRTGSVLFLLFFFTAGFSQQHTDSTALVKDSEILLAKKINFSWKGGTLPELFDQLGAEHELKFAYSEDKIEHTSFAAKTFNGISVMEVLESILKKSGFTYLVIGKTIAIVRDEQILENLPSTPDAKTKAGEITQGKETHIYPTSSMVNRLSSEEEKLLRKIYGKELRWKARHPQEAIGKDSSTAEKKMRSYATIPLIMGKAWYVRGNLGLDTYFLRYRNVSSLNWKEELNFISKPKWSLLAEAEVGLYYKWFILTTGVGIHKLSLVNTYKDPKAVPPPPGPAPPDAKEKSVTENYSVLTLPLQVLIFKSHKNIYFSGGGGIRINFIKRKSSKGSLKEYYNQYVTTDKFSELNSAVSYGISLRGEAGFNVSPLILVCGIIESTVSISPYFENSLYKFYPHSLSFKLSVVYFIP